MDFWVEVCHQGLQTPILFMTKIVHFTTLLKTREALNGPNSFVRLCCYYYYYYYDNDDDDDQYYRQY